jgi:hypothetical protein
VKTKITLFLSAALIGCLAGCSTNRHDIKTRKINPPLYLYFGCEGYGSAQRFLSTRIQPGNDILVGGDDYLELKGRIDRHGSKFVADISGATGGEQQFYEGGITLEEPFFGQGGAASGGVSLMWFIVSTNSNCLAVLERVNVTLGLTNSPFNRSISIPPPVLTTVTNVSPSDIDPVTGLPEARPPLDPTTGLPWSK